MKLHKKVVIALLASVATVGGAQAQVIGIDFYNYNYDSAGGTGFANQTPAGQAPSPTDVVGPYASAGWYNEFNLQNGPFLIPAASATNHGTGAILTDNSGAATTAAFGFNEFGVANALNGRQVYSPGYGAVGSPNLALTPNQQLFNGAAQATQNDTGYAQEVTLTNVPYATYDVYVLVGAVDGAVGYPPPTGGIGNITEYTDVNATTVQGSTFWFYGGTNSVIPGNGFSFIQATGTSQGTATTNANYALFSGNTNPNVTFDLASLSNDGNGGAYIAGLEIVDTAAVPEPSSYALLLSGVVALVGIRKLRSRSV
jgi:hypothetical protein